MKIGILSVACSLGPLALRAASPEPLSTPAKDLRSDTWTATDALGRALPGFDECGPRKGNRVVGMFYFVTHNNNGAKQGPFDVTKILAAVRSIRNGEAARTIGASPRPATIL